ncbi:uncharacterized protein ND-B17 [Lepeophtheirus salmonis]|nr:uncharacterized protein LOC121119082 [Lepeophtheirus salmonis]
MPVQSATSANNAFGFKVLNLQGPYYGFVRRSDPKWGGFEEADRVYRSRWLKDQVLASKDAKLDITTHPGYYKARVNIIRRVFRTPMDLFERGVATVTTPKMATFYRTLASYSFRLLALSWVVTYSTMYSTTDWTRVGGIRFLKTRPAIYPGDPNWPNVVEKKPHEYFDNGFYDTPFSKM